MGDALLDDGAVATADELIAALQGMILEQYALEDFEVTITKPGTVAVVTYGVRERLAAAGQTSERTTTAVSIWTGGDSWRLSLHHDAGQ